MLGRRGAWRDVDGLIFSPRLTDPAATGLPVASVAVTNGLELVDRSSKTTSSAR